MSGVGGGGGGPRQQLIRRDRPALTGLGLPSFQPRALAVASRARRQATILRDTATRTNAACAEMNAPADGKRLTSGGPFGSACLAILVEEHNARDRGEQQTKEKPQPRAAVGCLRPVRRENGEQEYHHPG
jgi:hypothetical protein